jgi:hypothetical protein
MGNGRLRPAFPCLTKYASIKRNTTSTSQNVALIVSGEWIFILVYCITSRVMVKPVIAEIMDPVEKLDFTSRWTSRLILTTTCTSVTPGVAEFGRLIVRPA